MGAGAGMRHHPAVVELNADRRAQFYERIGYEHIKTQYAFIKALDTAPQKDNGRFVPKVED